MGQAIADLPNSTSPPAETTGNADDLLSQLAGEEIDRLLAEAETEPTHADAEPTATIEPASIAELPATAVEHTEIAALPLEPGEQPVPATQLSEPVAIAGGDVAEDAPSAVIDAVVEKEIAEMAAASAAAQPTEDAFAAQVDELFKELKDLPEAETAAAAPADKPKAPAEAEPLSPAAAEIAAELDREANLAERAALQPAAPASTAEQPSAAAASDDDAPPSVLVKVLEVVNSPVDSMPDTLRDALGKIAILTTMNALGVLLYLVLFRR